MSCPCGLNKEEVRFLHSENQVLLVGGICQNPFADGSERICGKTLGAHPLAQGTGVDEPKKVPFEFLDVPVIHWQHLVAKKIPISESTTFLDFCIKIRASFSDEITTEMFRVYRLPHKFSSIDEKVLIDSNEKFQECASLFKNPFKFPPVLYIWNYEDESPNVQKDRDCASVVSRESNQNICKEKDGYICLCCRFFGQQEGLTMKCCHLYEIEPHEALTTVAERKDKMKSLKLVDINDHQIGIHPVDRRWIITDTLRGGIDAPSITPYRDIHGRAVVFTSETYEPPLEVLEDRFVHFLKKTVHYCHFCLESFSGVSGLADKGKHVEMCRVTTLTREMSRKGKRK
eukprot:gene32182-41722_t